MMTNRQFKKAINKAFQEALERSWNTEENMETTPELKPCPFCGGKAEVEDISGHPFVYCTECHASTNYACSTDIKNAAMIWNTRYEDKKHMECQKCCHYDSTKTSVYRPKAHWCRFHAGWFENDFCCKYYAVNWMEKQEKLDEIIKV